MSSTKRTTTNHQTDKRIFQYTAQGVKKINLKGTTKRGGTRL